MNFCARVRVLMPEIPAPDAVRDHLHLSSTMDGIQGVFNDYTKTWTRDEALRLSQRVGLKMGVFLAGLFLLAVWIIPNEWFLQLGGHYGGYYNDGYYGITGMVPPPSLCWMNWALIYIDLWPSIQWILHDMAHPVSHWFAEASALALLTMPVAAMRQRQQFQNNHITAIRDYEAQPISFTISANRLVLTGHREGQWAWTEVKEACTEKRRLHRFKSKPAQYWLSPEANNYDDHVVVLKLKSGEDLIVHYCSEEECRQWLVRAIETHRQGLGSPADLPEALRDMRRRPMDEPTPPES